jgi:LacI family transcriptional regulator
MARVTRAGGWQEGKGGFRLSEREFLPEKLASEFVRQIIREDLWGKRLPSQRQLSRSLRVSLEVVNQAIALLRKANYVTSVPKQGVYVCTQKTLVPLSHGQRRMMFVCESPQIDPRLGGYIGRAVEPLLRLTAGARMDAIFSSLSEHAFEGSLLNAWSCGPEDFLVFVATSRNPDLIRQISARNACRQVMLDHHIEGLGITGVVDDGHAGMAALTRHLLQQGHRRIAYFDNQEAASNPWKRAGFLETLQAAGVPTDPALLIFRYPHPAIIESILKKLLCRPDPPTAFVAVDDSRAIMLLKILRHLGLTPGRDVAVTGYGDTAHVDGANEDLTSVRCDPAKLGNMAIDYLLGKIPDADGAMLKVEAELVVRGSSQCRVHG